MEMCESYLDPLEEKKMFCTKCGTAIDGCVPFCSSVDVKYTSIIIDILQAQMMKKK